MASGIYRILNTVNGKSYVGSAVVLSKRLRQHRGDLVRGSHSNVKLQRAWNKAGSEAFLFYTIESIHDTARLLEREQFWIKFYRVIKHGYNLSPTAGSTLGIPISAVSRRKMALAQLQRAPMSEETRRKISDGLKGRPVSKETRERIAAAQKGKTRWPYQSKEWRAMMSGKMAGRSHSPETRERLRQAQLGKTHSVESRRKMSLSHTGKPIAPETVAKRAATITGRRHTPEAIERMRHAQRLAHQGRIYSEATRARWREAARNRPPCSDDTRRKLSEAGTGRPVSMETRAKIGAANRKYSGTCEVIAQ